jgi:hypothetical protein
MTLRLDLPDLLRGSDLPQFLHGLLALRQSKGGASTPVEGGVDAHVRGSRGTGDVPRAEDPDAFRAPTAR